MNLLICGGVIISGDKWHFCSPLYCSHPIKIANSIYVFSQQTNKETKTIELCGNIKTEDLEILYSLAFRRTTGLQCKEEEEGNDEGMGIGVGGCWWGWDGGV